MILNKIKNLEIVKISTRLNKGLRQLLHMTFANKYEEKRLILLKSLRYDTRFNNLSMLLDPYTEAHNNRVGIYFSVLSNIDDEYCMKRDTISQMICYRFIHRDKFIRLAEKLPNRHLRKYLLSCLSNHIIIEGQSLRIKSELQVNIDKFKYKIVKGLKIEKFLRWIILKFKLNDKS